MQGTIAIPNTGFRKARDSQRLRINVLFTTPSETRIALKRAAALSAGLDAEILLIVPQIVPFPLELDNPPVALDFVSHQLLSIVESVDADLDGYVYLCRDRLQTFLYVLRANSITVLGIRRRWLFSRTERLARVMRRHGHQVILATSPCRQ